MPNTLQVHLDQLAATLARDIAALIGAASLGELLTMDTTRRIGASAPAPVKRGRGRPRKIPLAPAASSAPETPLTERPKAGARSEPRGVKELLSFLRAKRQQGRTVQAIRNHLGPRWTDTVSMANQQKLVRHDGASAFAASPYYEDTRYWLK